MPGTTLSEHGIPGALRTAVSDTLDAYNQNPGRKGRDELEEAVARTHRIIERDYSGLPTDGPHAAANGLLVYSIPRTVWTQHVCEALNVRGKARDWALKVHEHAADRAAREDPHVSLDRVREHYTSDERVAVVVEHP